VKQTILGERLDRKGGDSEMKTASAVEDIRSLKCEKVGNGLCVKRNGIPPLAFENAGSKIELTIEVGSFVPLKGIGAGI
jgi:hypothetical protein